MLGGLYEMLGIQFRVSGMQGKCLTPYTISPTPYFSLSRKNTQSSPSIPLSRAQGLLLDLSPEGTVSLKKVKCRLER